MCSSDLDDFQNFSYNGIHDEKVVLTNAPTGSGKTRVIHYAIAYYIKKGYSVAVTIPIKALSNQQYRDICNDLKLKLKELVGREVTIGIMTGDRQINPDADCIIMTTEILNESLNKFGDKDYKKELHLKPSFVDRLGCVICDEAHYFNDKDRGKVWESVLIKLKKHINVVLLSATLPNVQWFAQ